MSYLLGIIALTFSVFASAQYAQAATLAFPGAEGFGKFAKGGRGGRVIEVTNLNDSGAGSFRAAVEASGPRTVVFRVGGTINLDPSKKPPRISHPFITIAGQTAPGDGITIKGGMLDIRASHVIVRHIRIRPGHTVFNPAGGDAIQVFAFLNDVHDVMIDHVSMSWTTDEMFSVYAEPHEVRNVTIQWSSIAESLDCSTHPKGCHSTGMLVAGGDNVSGVSIHHNLFAHHEARNPLISNGDVDIVNNVMYNYGIQATGLQPWQGLVRANVVGNYYLPGPNSPNGTPPIRLIGNAVGAQPFAQNSRVYLENNAEPVFALTGTENQQNLVKLSGVHGGFPQSNTRFNYPIVTTTDPAQAKTDVLANVGATLPSRDTVDARIVSEVRNGSGHIISHTSEVGGWPSFSSGTPPIDTDHDGMPDSWEVAKGFNPSNAADRLQDLDDDGNTNLEEYLNGTEPGKDKVPPVPPANLRIVN